ncbi:MAG: hypothetical protein IPJ74_13405 [Saprospiraceae bacterium]|nr:hypothetical protein [Saprospiraceae bacterium]
MRRFFKNGKPINWRYAIGEVALIFIGITLALAFGNWNQNRQERQTETKLLREMHANLDETAKVLKAISTLIEQHNFPRGNHKSNYRGIVLER